MYEQEADRVAEQVMRMPEPTVMKEEEEEILQPKELPGYIPEVTPDLEARIQSQRGIGHPLPETTRAFFEPRFGRDFSAVRIHADTRLSRIFPLTKLLDEALVSLETAGLLQEDDHDFHHTATVYQGVYRPA